MIKSYRQVSNQKAKNIKLWSNFLRYDDTKGKNLLKTSNITNKNPLLPLPLCSSPCCFRRLSGPPHNLRSQPTSQLPDTEASEHDITLAQSQSQPGTRSLHPPTELLSPAENTVKRRPVAQAGGCGGFYSTHWTIGGSCCVTVCGRLCRMQGARAAEGGRRVKTR